MKQLIVLLIVSLILNCSGKTKNPVLFAERILLGEKSKIDSIDVIKLGTGTNFKFKGLAIDVKNLTAYLGSYDKKEIVAVSLLNGAYEVIKTKYSGRLNGMGCYLKNNKLYAVMNEVEVAPDSKDNLIAALLVIDITTKKLIHSYESKGINGRNHFNHIVVDENGVAYISDTLKSSIYTVNTNNSKDTLKLLVEHKDLSWVHGIDLSADGNKLFTTSYGGGIKFFNLKTKTFSGYRDTILAGDDGLKYYKGFLYGVGQNMIKKYTLDHSENKVIKTDTLIRNHEYFNDPRSLHIENGVLYCLANIEFEPVNFRSINETHRNTALTDSYLIKFNLIH